MNTRSSKRRNTSGEIANADDPVTKKKGNQSISNRSKKSSGYKQHESAPSTTRGIRPAIEKAVSVVDTGVENFARVRHFPGYVDKSKLIEALLNINSSRILLIAPRRIGKSVNLKMLIAFFEKCDNIHKQEANKELFKGLYIQEKCPEIVNDYFGKFPVIFLNFNTHGPITDYNAAYAHVCHVVHVAYMDHSYLKNSVKIVKDDDKAFIKKWCSNTYLKCDIHEKDFEKFTKATHVYVEMALKNLARYLCLHHEVEQLHLYVDEYDNLCTKSAFGVTDDIERGITANKELEKIIELSIGAIACLAKGNDRINHAILTGISYLMTCGLSGLNNFTVYRFQENHPFSAFYGLTTEEVRNFLLPKFGMSNRFDDIKNFYNGYSNSIYNTLSIMHYIIGYRYDSNLEPQNYWSQTGVISNLNEALHLSCVKTIILLLLSDVKFVKVKYIKNLTYDMLWNLKSILRNENQNLKNADIFINFLLEQGYFAIAETSSNGTEVTIKIPNQEIRIEFREKIFNFFEMNYQLDIGLAKECAYLFDNLDLQTVNESLQNICNVLNEIFVSLVIPSPNEATFYHIFFIIAFYCSNFKVFSEVQSCKATGKILDLCLMNLDRKLGIIIELKFEKTEDEALDQILDRKYYDAFTNIKYNPDKIKLDFKVLIGLNVSSEKKITMSVLVNSIKKEDAKSFKEVIV